MSLGKSFTLLAIIYYVYHWVAYILWENLILCKNACFRLSLCLGYICDQRLNDLSGWKVSKFIVNNSHTWPPQCSNDSVHRALLQHTNLVRSHQQLQRSSQWMVMHYFYDLLQQPVCKELWNGSMCAMDTALSIGKFIMLKGLLTGLTNCMHRYTVWRVSNTGVQTSETTK